MAADTGEGAAPPPKKNADLKARTLSAIVMVAISGTALWLGGIAWTAFVLLVATGVLWEWNKLSRKIASSWWGRAFWLVAGVVYVGVASASLVSIRGLDPILSLIPIIAVIATDVGAYFAGRTFGGPKIAAKISPSKTWSGLIGGILGAACVFAFVAWRNRDSLMCDNFGEQSCWSNFALFWQSLLSGTLIAIIAQTGDFFESWMKRRAGVKDSSNLIPGHGGLFDRLDGLLAVLFVVGLWGGIVSLVTAYPAQLITVSTTDK